MTLPTQAVLRAFLLLNLDMVWLCDGRGIPWLEHEVFPSHFDLRKDDRATRLLRVRESEANVVEANIHIRRKLAIY